MHYLWSHSEICLPTWSRTGSPCLSNPEFSWCEWKVPRWRVWVGMHILTDSQHYCYSLLHALQYLQCIHAQWASTFSARHMDRFMHGQRNIDDVSMTGLVCYDYGHWWHTCSLEYNRLYKTVLISRSLTDIQYTNRCSSRCTLQVFLWTSPLLAVQL